MPQGEEEMAGGEEGKNFLVSGISGGLYARAQGIEQEAAEEAEEVREGVGI
jgi:hypothetical protein